MSYIIHLSCNNLEFKKFEEKTFPNKIKETYQNQSIEFFHSQKDVLRTKLKKIELLLEEDINEEHGMQCATQFDIITFCTRFKS